MIKLSKTRRGFTLIEMVLVIAIILILTMVILFSVSKYVHAANTASSKVEAHNSYVEEVYGEALENG